MHTCTCNLQTHKNAQSGVGKTKSIKKWCRVFNSSLSQFKITQIVYLGGVEIPADLRKELSQICKDMKLPAPFIAGPGSVNDPLFRQIWSNYTSDREDQKGDEPLTSGEQNKRTVLSTLGDEKRASGASCDAPGFDLDRNGFRLEVLRSA